MIGRRFFGLKSVKAVPPVDRSSLSNRFTPVVGLEIHCQPALESKLFSGAKGDSYRTPVNENVSLFDASLPGTLPVLNRRCVELGVSAAFLLNCRLNFVSHFDRKHYFYADLPTGYQITQQRTPLAVDGHIDYYVPTNDNGGLEKKRTKILKIQLEQDSGKSLWDVKNNRTLVDLNRAGVALMEIVTEPNLHSGLEAAALVRELHFMLKSTGICQGHMERGHMRVDANVSVADAERPELGLGVRTEVKNINSFKFVQKAVEFELIRQQNIIESGGDVLGETRVYDYKTGVTTGMRDKEVWLDYRFMPEPNLPPLRIFDSQLGPLPTGSIAEDQLIDCAKLRESLNQQKLLERNAWVEAGMPVATALQLSSDDSLFQFFHESFKQIPLLSVAFFTSVVFDEYLPTLRMRHKEISNSPVEIPAFTELVKLLDGKKITLSGFKKILHLLMEGSTETPEAMLNRLGLHRHSEASEVERACGEVIEELPKAVRDFKRGKQRVMSLLVAKADEKLNYRVDATVLEQFYRTKLH